MLSCDKLDALVQFCRLVLLREGCLQACTSLLKEGAALDDKLRHHVYCILLYCILLYCILLYCILLYCILLLYIVILHIVILHIVILQAIKTIACFASSPVPDAVGKLSTMQVCEALVSAAVSRVRSSQLLTGMFRTSEPSSRSFVQDKEVQRLAVLALAALSSTPASHNYLIRCYAPALLARSCFGRDAKWCVMHWKLR
eukprot:SAG31_NODE_1011_length_10382_cov_8.910240_6_plen_200_part_00